MNSTANSEFKPMQSVLDAAEFAGMVVRSRVISRTYCEIGEGPQSYAEANRRGLDSEINFLTHAASQLFESVVSRLRARNRLSSIHRLPDELLAATFNYVAESDFYAGAPVYRGLLLISAVSSDWRRIALHCPVLWSRISPHTPLSITGLFLERSAAVELDIRYDTTGDTQLDYQHLEMCSHHVNRWKSLRINGVEISAIEEATRVPALRLEALHIRSSTGATDRGQSLGGIFGGIAPSLSHVVLEAVYIPLDSFIYHNLTTLVIRNVTFRRAFAIQAFLDILVASPRLNKLGLHHLAFTMKPPLSSPSDRPIPLSHLRVLEISEYEEAWCNLYILSHVTAPPSLCLIVHSSVFKGQRLDTMVPATLDLFSHIHCLQFAMEGAAGAQSTLRVRGFGSDRTPLLVLTLEGSSQYQGVLSAFADGYTMPHLCVVELESLSDDSTIPLTGRFLARHNHITDLAFHKCPASAVNLLTVSPGRFLCPQLARLLVSSCPVTPFGLLGAIGSRTSGGAASVVPIQTLYISPPFAAASRGKAELEQRMNVAYV
ncbi:hypothetical protein BOTBODRAFT_30242 [Botryobasidium botryosum FD-172 SS1]|uniref:Uncharacterized protein n=1 Tax=Botryobasidium botryosum (strain FD-172 SS1) TaxID=930990 RepID=A0A067MZD7_BOTB1|nr:hypothetical protein BOTBODRAFT_30242 [Botryobasidium botryosum FD-172 SS1]